jgi:hypothetical protein
MYLVRKQVGPAAAVDPVAKRDIPVVM